MEAQPVLSVVVTVVSDTSQQADLRHLVYCLEALRKQVDPPAMEILVTCEGGLPGIESLRQRFPEAGFLELGELRQDRSRPTREHHDVLRGIGLRKARGAIIASLEDHDRPAPNWCAQIVKEHNQPHAAIGGAVENGIDRALNWAVYFCDFGRYQNPVLRGPARSLSDANVSYKRAALESVSAVWANAYNEILIHAALLARGEIIYLSPDVVVFQHRLDLKLVPALRERYVWGRSYGAVRLVGRAWWQRAVFVLVSPLLPLVLLRRQAAEIFRSGRNRGAFIRALPATVLLDLFWSWGEFVGAVTGRAVGSS
jgi:hypothetical protein